MRHGSLFSGIGGFDLAAEWMGWENVFHCEWNEFCQKVLKYYWPNAKSYGDIDTTDFTIWRGLIDVLSGGFPCQPYSAAGKRKGKEDDRHKWPQMLRSIREIQPRWIVGENVYGLVNWSGGLVFDEVQSDLENEGYEVTPFILPACAINAPHRRDRVWFVAYNNKFNGNRAGLRTSETPQQQKDALQGFSTTNSADTRIKSERQKQEDTVHETGFASNTDSGIGCEGWMYETESKEAEGYVSTRNARIDKRGTWENFPTQSPVCSRNDGLPTGLVPITVPKRRGGERTLTQQQSFGKIRNESIRGYGNAIVPQVVYQIFLAIAEYKKLK